MGKKSVYSKPRDAWLYYQEQAEILLMMCENITLEFPYNQFAMMYTASLLQETLAHTNPQTFAALWQAVVIVLNLEGWTIDMRNFVIRNTLSGDGYKIRIRGLTDIPTPNTFSTIEGYNSWWREYRKEHGIQ